MGGDCLNTGCVPSRLCWRKCTQLMQSAGVFGVTAPGAIIGAKVHAHVQGVIAAIAPNDSARGGRLSVRHPGRRDLQGSQDARRRRYRNPRAPFRDRDRIDAGGAADLRT
jgi:hypothetical protein